MRLTFVLPGFVTVPMGGVKIVNEYANRLAARGHQVTLVYPLYVEPAPLSLLKRLWSSPYDSKSRLYYHPDPAVDVLVVRNLSDKYLPAGDALIACGWQTARAVAAAPHDCGRKYYFLQSFETYFQQTRRVIDTYHLPLTKIAISQWILDELQAISESGLGPLGNAIDPREFYLEEKMQRAYDVLFFYHHRRIKGARTGLQVIKRLKTCYPSLKVCIVAPRQPIHRLPKGCELIIRPSIPQLRQLYNSTKVLLYTSRWEGWGLPPMEAMACGCAVVAVANRGVREYLRNEENALLCAPDDPADLIAAVEVLINEPSKREHLIRAGLETVQKYDWDTIVTKMESYLKGE